MSKYEKQPKRKPRRIMTWLSLLAFTLCALMTFAYAPLFAFLKLLPVFQDGGYINTQSLGSFFLALRDALGLFAIATFLSHFIQLDNITDRIKDTLAFTFTTGEEGKGLFTKFTPQTRSAIVKNVLRASLDDVYGEKVYGGVVKRYMEGERDYRRNFLYKITCHDQLDFPQLKDKALQKLMADLQNEDYIWVEQELSYTQHEFIYNKELKKLTAQIAMSDSLFRASIRDEALFFREILHLDDELAKGLLALNERQLRSLMRDVFNFKAYSLAPQNAQGEPSRNELDFRIWWTKPQNLSDQLSGQKYITIEIENPSGESEGSGCVLSFRLPHKNDASYFVVTMPKPTEAGAIIQFTKSDQMTGLAAVPYLPKDAYQTVATPRGQDDNPDALTITTKEWTFPTGGITFVWRPKNKPQSTL